MRSSVLAVTIVFVVTTLVLTTATLPVTVLHEWKNLEFSFESGAQKEYAIAKGLYKPKGQKLPYDVDVDRSGRKFLSIPRVSDGVPFTLAVIDETQSTANGPLLKPYPNMDFHLNRSCDGLFSVYRMRIEPSCNRLWVIDSGLDLFVADAPTLVCPPKIVVFNLDSDKVEFQHVIPSKQFNAKHSVFSSITVLSGQFCKDSIAYLSDSHDNRLVVYDHKGRKSWQTISLFYEPKPDYMKATIAKESFMLSDGLYSIAPSIEKGQLYFHVWASNQEVYIPLQLINNPLLWLNSPSNEILYTVRGWRTTQSASQVVDSQGLIWFSQLEPLAIYSWNPILPYSWKYFNNETIDEQNFQFISGLKTNCHRRTGEKLLGLSNRLQKHITGTVKPSEINYRIFSIPIRGASEINDSSLLCWD